MRLLLDEMYPPRLAQLLGEAGIDAVTVADAGLAGASDADVFAAAREAERTVVTENVADFVQLAADRTLESGQHPGVLLALSSRFSRRPAGLSALVSAVQIVADQDVRDRVVYLTKR